LNNGVWNNVVVAVGWRELAAQEVCAEPDQMVVPVGDLDCLWQCQYGHGVVIILAMKKSESEERSINE
jgi:hypothetical protein